MAAADDTVDEVKLRLFEDIVLLEFNNMGDFALESVKRLLRGRPLEIE